MLVMVEGCPFSSQLYYSEYNNQLKSGSRKRGKQHGWLTSL